MTGHQRVVVYTHPTTGKPTVYATWYTQDQMRRALVRCRRRHGEGSDPRSRSA